MGEPNEAGAFVCVKSLDMTNDTSGSGKVKSFSGGVRIIVGSREAYTLPFESIHGFITNL